eukprot:7173658-Prorocentrum_lima.AAC.1
MTSSLVGSEMCIRDREGPVSQAGTYQGNQYRHVRAPPGPPPHGSYRASVSYTHLTLPTICSV